MASEQHETQTIRCVMQTLGKDQALAKKDTKQSVFLCIKIEKMLLTRQSSRTSLSYPLQQTEMLPSTNKTNEILSVLGVAGRISCLPPTHSRFPVIRTREIQNRGEEGFDEHVYTSQAQIVTDNSTVNCGPLAQFLCCLQTKHLHVGKKQNPV